MGSIIEVYELPTRTCDLSRYGTRERPFYPSDRQAVSMSAIWTETCASLQIEGLLQLVSTREANRQLWRCTNACDHCVDLARQHRRALLTSQEDSTLKRFQVFSDCIEAAQPFW